jgi:hypothetical protein
MSRCITKLIKQQNIMNKQKKQQKETEDNGLYTLLPTEKITKIKYPIGGFAPGHYE